MIIDHLEMSNDVRFIAHGTVRIVVRMLEGREVIFNDLEAGQFFGELAAIDNGPRSANASAHTNVQICIMHPLYLAPPNQYKEFMGLFIP